MVDLVLPELGEGIEKATVAFWHCTVGDSVKEGDDIVEVVTDKATFNVPAPVTGLVREIFIEKDQDVNVGQALASIE